MNSKLFCLWHLYHNVLTQILSEFLLRRQVSGSGALTGRGRLIKLDQGHNHSFTFLQNLDEIFCTFKAAPRSYAKSLSNIKSKHLKGDPVSMTSRFSSHRGQLAPHISDVMFFNRRAQLGPCVSDLTFF